MFFINMHVVCCGSFTMRGHKDEKSSDFRGMSLTELKLRGSNKEFARGAEEAGYGVKTVCVAAKKIGGCLERNAC